MSNESKIALESKAKSVLFGNTNDVTIKQDGSVNFEHKNTLLEVWHYE